jgi:N6-adenosine-specific RNA methylase IME4
MVAADLGRMRQGTRTDLSPAGEKSQRERAELVGVGKRSVERADIIVARGVPQLAAAVCAGRLTVSIAEKIAKLPAEQQRGVVGESDAGELSRRARAALAKYRRDCRIEQIASGTANLPDKKYAVIYCDIPRRFNAWSAETGLERSPDNHYPTMTFDELLRIPVRDLAAEDCVLFFWSTSASLLDDLEIIAEWGFAPLRPRDEFGRLRCDAQGSSLQPVGEGSYRSHQVWVKDRVGTGYWFRNQHELLLVCVRGDVPAPLFGSQDASIVTAPVTKHSEKPLRFRGMIDRHYPNVPKIELFCRGQPAPGWGAYGNEADTPESISNSALSRVSGLRQPGDIGAIHATDNVISPGQWGLKPLPAGAEFCDGEAGEGAPT